MYLSLFVVFIIFLLSIMSIFKRRFKEIVFTFIIQFSFSEIMEALLLVDEHLSTIGF